MKQRISAFLSEFPQLLTTNRIEILVGLFATALIAIGLLLYAVDEPDRIVVAQQAQLSLDVDEAMSLYAQNCAVCHGLAGEGISSIPPLDNPALRDGDAPALAKIISRGLYGTAMPAWSSAEGGSLSDYQISQLVMLVQNGSWQLVQDRVVNLGLAPQVPFTTEADPQLLEQVQALPGGELLAQGISLYAQECVACHGADGLGSRMAPALNDPQVREKTADELLRTIQNGVAGTLMASWANTLQTDQQAALIELITRWDEVPGGTIPAPDRPVAVTAESLAIGSDLFTQNCARCHGPEGQGTQRAPSLNVKGYLADTNDAALVQIVTFGVTGTAMPAWGDRLDEAQIQAIVGFMRSWEPTAPEVAVPARGGGGPWWSTNSSQPSGQYLPSGGQRGQGKGQGGPPSGRGPSSQSAAASPVVGANPTLQPASEAQAVAQPTAAAAPAATAAAASGQVGTPAAAGHAGQASAGAEGQAAGSGPPWARTTAPADEGFSLNWLVENWRASGLIFAGLLVGVTLVGGAAVGLRRLR